MNIQVGEFSERECNYHPDQEIEAASRPEAFFMSLPSLPFFHPKSLSWFLMQ